jgi:hypothetical protein
MNRNHFSIGDAVVVLVPVIFLEIGSAFGLGYLAGEPVGRKIVGSLVLLDEM